MSGLRKRIEPLREMYDSLVESNWEGTTEDERLLWADMAWVLDEIERLIAMGADL